MRRAGVLGLVVVLLALPSVGLAQEGPPGNTLPAFSAESSGAESGDDPGLWWLPLAGLGAAAAAGAAALATRGTKPFSRAWASRLAAVLAVLALLGAYTVGSVIARDPDERARYSAPAEPLAPLGQP